MLLDSRYLLVSDDIAAFTFDLAELADFERVGDHVTVEREEYQAEREQGT